MPNWEYLVVPLEDASALKKKSGGMEPDRLNRLGGEGWRPSGSRGSEAI